MKKIVGAVLSVSFALGTTACFHESCEKGEETFAFYEIIAEYVPENATLAGTVKLTFENVTENEISTLKFQLYPNAYRADAVYKPISTALAQSAYYDGESYGEMVISSVNGAKNWEVTGEDENVLYAHLERALYPGDKVVLDIGFMTKLAKVNHRTGITAHTVNLGNFFPVLCALQEDGFYETTYSPYGDSFYTDCADFTVTLKTPKDYVVASSGTVVEERVLESKKQRTLSLQNARDFAVVLSETYRVLQETVNGKTLRYYYYDDATPQTTLETVKDAFAYYEQTFGEYPYPTYSLAQTELCKDGAEYPALAMISIVEVTPHTLARETAHQWWYAVVGNNPVENGWQDEGLAEYSALTFFENYEKYAVSKDERVREALREYRSYYDVYGSVLGRTDTKMTRPLKEYVSEHEYKCIAQNKTVVMLDTLRKSVGDNKFFASLKRYYKDNAFSVASVGDFIGAFEKTGLDVAGYFDSFLSGVAIL